MDQAKTVKNSKHSTVLSRCLSEEFIGTQKQILFQEKKIPTKPKFQLPRKIRKDLKEEYSLATMEQPSTKLKRINSSNGPFMFQKENEGQSMVNFFQRENQNLLKQNKFLVKQVRKRKQNEENLLAYIEELKEEISNLKEISSRVEKPRLTEATSTGTTNSNECIHPSYFQDDLHAEIEMQNLNNKFNQLMEECSKEKIQKEKLMKRQQIAYLAQKMKFLRKNIANIQ